MDTLLELARAVLWHGCDINKTHLTLIKDLINDYVRKECEKIDSEAVEYLWSLQALINSDKLRIFTLNYDGTIEIICTSTFQMALTNI